MPNKSKVKKLSSKGKVANISTISQLPTIRALAKIVDTKGRLKLTGRQEANPSAGEYLVFSQGDEVVLVHLKAGQACPIIFEYDKTCETKLGRVIAKALAEGGFGFQFNQFS